MITYIIAALASIIGVGFAFISVKLYLNDRKYSHIPGPKNDGQVKKFRLSLNM